MSAVEFIIYRWVLFVPIVDIQVRLLFVEIKSTKGGFIQSAIVSAKC